MSHHALRHISPALTAGAVGVGVGLGCCPSQVSGDSGGDELRRGALLGARHHEDDDGEDHRPHGHRGRRRRGDHPVASNQGIPGIDSLVNFDVILDAPGFAADGAPQSTWIMNLVGNPPEQGGRTVITAPIVPVSIDLLDVDGSLRVFNGVTLHQDVTPFIEPTLRSPLFRPTSYSSSRHPTQFTDAIQRAQVFKQARPDWHTWLAPVVRPTRTLSIPFGSYRFALNADSTCCAFVTIDEQVFQRLFFPVDPSDVTTPVGAAENAGDMTPHDLTTFLLPDTFLYAANTPGNCCILGFHTYDFEPGDAGNGNRERRFVVAIASWISPGRLSGVEDVSALSHELVEAFNDPFVGTDGVRNITPWWRGPSGTCQNKNEISDVVEGLPNAVFPVVMPDTTDPLTYHLQNQALLPWFRAGQASDAIHGAYSYPDETLLMAPAPLLPAFCQ